MSNLTLGVIGGGQLARMLATAAEPLNVKVIALEKTMDCPAAINCEIMLADYADQSALQQLAKQTDCITFEFENVDVEAIKQAQLTTYPQVDALCITQDRLTEKHFLRELNIPTVDFQAIDLAESFEHRLPFERGVLKTTRLGYDGKGQFRFTSAAEFNQHIASIEPQIYIAEEWMTFDYEVSLIAVRGKNGKINYYPLTKNEHINGILHRSTAPLDNMRLQSEAEGIAQLLLNTLDYVGVLTIEFFVLDQKLYVNELAPRVHNSGHWTIEGAVTSQFANHVRAVFGMPLGDTSIIAPCEMINCIGEMPVRDDVLTQSSVYLHDYGKAARPGRKLGHITRLFL